VIEYIKISESFIRVFSDTMIEQEIRDFFTFKVPGYQFSPKYKARLWDGNISLYDSRTRKLPIGLLRQLETFAKESAYELSFRPSEKYQELDESIDITYDEFKEFIDDLEVAKSGKPIEIRDYQYEAAFHAIKNRRCVLISPTSSGKSLILYSCIRWLIDQNPDAKILLIVPNVQLVEQMFSDFQDYSTINDFHVESHMQKLYSGKDKTMNRNVLISTWQSISSIIKKSDATFLESFTSVFIDESHGATGKEIQGILEKMTNASHRIGTTGTLQSEKVHKLVIEGFLGPSHKVITTKELMDAKQVSEIKIRPVVLSYNDIDRDFCKKMTYPDETTFIIGNQSRLNKVAKITAGMPGTTLILVSRRDDHAVPLFEEIKKYANRPVYYIAGDVDAEDREEIRQKANQEDCIIVATYRTMSTGTNIPNIKNVIFGSTSKSMITVLQSIGRGLRLASDKTHMTLIDFIDDLRYKKRENYAYQHSEARIRIYRREHFTICQPLKVNL
jgi:superfamily II DNA or RNA helicase